MHNRVVARYLLIAALLAVLLVHYRFLNRRVNLPLHPSWAEWLWERGFASGEAEALHSVGIHAYRCRPDATQIEEDVGAAVRRGRLTVPDGDELAEAA